MGLISQSVPTILTYPKKAIPWNITLEVSLSASILSMYQSYMSEHPQPLLKFPFLMSKKDVPGRLHLKLSWWDKQTPLGSLSSKMG